MDKAIVALSFDDGRLDNYTNAYPILKKYELPATFNITTGYIEGKINREEFCFPESMTVSMVRELFDDSKCEIAGHGYYHINTQEDIVTGIHGLCRMLNTNYLYDEMNGFASPGSDLTESMYKGMKPILDSNHIAYVRVSCRYKGLRLLKILLRKISRVIKWPLIYKWAYQDSLMDEYDGSMLYSIPVLSSTTPGQIEAIIAQAIRKKKACVLMIHSIVASENIRDTWDYGSDNFISICGMLSQYRDKGLLKISTTMDMFHKLNNKGNK